MALTQTFTSTRTFARQDLLKLQVKLMLRRGSDISPENLAGVERGLDQHWIRWVMLYGLDRADRLVAELTFEIDWASHKILIQGGHDTVAIPGSWIASTAPELDEAIRAFEASCKRLGLSQEWRVRYDSWVNASSANIELGFSPARPVMWRNTPEELRLGIGELEEATVTIRLA